jgi:hypothetical protein
MARSRNRADLAESVTDVSLPEGEDQEAQEGAQESAEGAEASAPLTVATQGYSGSGALADLLKVMPKRLETEETIQAREQAAREAATAEMAKAFAAQIVAASPDGEWIRYDVADEVAAKRLRRIINQGAETVDRNFAVRIGEVPEETVATGFDPESGEATDFDTIPAHWAVDVRTTRQTGAGRPPANRAQGSEAVDSEAEGEQATPEAEGAPEGGSEAA